MQNFDSIHSISIFYSSFLALIINHTQKPITHSFIHTLITFSHATHTHITTLNFLSPIPMPINNEQKKKKNSKLHKKEQKSHKKKEDV